MALPDPDQESEDRFIQQWMETDEVEELTDLITQAVESRRPKLAARLFGLLDGRVDIPQGSALERASNAARFLLLKPQSIDHQRAFEEAWTETRRVRIRRIKHRMRDRITGTRTRSARVSRRNPKK